MRQRHHVKMRVYHVPFELESQLDRNARFQNTTEIGRLLQIADKRRLCEGLALEHVEGELIPAYVHLGNGFMESNDKRRKLQEATELVLVKQTDSDDADNEVMRLTEQALANPNDMAARGRLETVFIVQRRAREDECRETSRTTACNIAYNFAGMRRLNRKNEADVVENDVLARLQ